MTGQFFSKYIPWTENKGEIAISDIICNSMCLWHSQFVLELIWLAIAWKLFTHENLPILLTSGIPKKTWMIASTENGIWNLHKRTTSERYRVPTRQTASNWGNHTVSWLFHLQRLNGWTIEHTELQPVFSLRFWCHSPIRVSNFKINSPRQKFTCPDFPL